MFLIYGLLQLVSNIIAWTMPLEAQTSWQFIKLAQRVPLWAWIIGILLLVIGVMFEGSYRIYTRRTKELDEEQQSKIAAIESKFEDERQTFTAQIKSAEETILSLNSQLKGQEKLSDDRGRRRCLREKLGEFLAAGEEIRWGMLAHDMEKHGQFKPWLEQVKNFLEQEPEFDRSHLARFEATQTGALHDFIKELRD